MYNETMADRRLMFCCHSVALGPNSAAITALEGKVEAVRTAMTASVKLMIQELAAAVEQAGEASSISTAMGPGVGSGVAGVQVCRHVCWVGFVRAVWPACCQKLQCGICWRTYLSSILLVTGDCLSSVLDACIMQCGTTEQACQT
jgi:hypothetical protein